MSLEFSSPFVLNCSRVGRYGGLKTHADEVMRSVLARGCGCTAVVPADYIAPDGVDSIFTPASFAGATNLSLLRPIKWFIYSYFKFPIPERERILCTTHHVIPGRFRQVVTIHDLRPYFLPDTAVQSFYFHHVLPRALKHCDGIISSSETSRKLIAEVYKIPLDRIAVVPLTVRQPERFTLKPVLWSEPFLLVVGASWGHKNIETLLRQQALWSREYGLKIVGGRGPYLTRLEKLASSLGISDRIEFLSDVSTGRLEQLYAGCSALVYPSKMEGFGLPPLEAMVRRRPAIVADIPVFRELYGPHALFVQVENADSWQKAFSTLPSIDSIQLDAAREHAATFNHSRMAHALNEALHRFWSL